MCAKRIITRIILSAAAAGSIATGVAVPLATTVAPSSGIVAITSTANVIVLHG